MAENKSLTKDKYFYVVYGLKLISDYEFPQFMSGEFGVEDADIEIEYGGIPDSIHEKIAEGCYACNGNHEKWFINKVGIFWIHGDRKINFTEFSEGTIDDAAQYLPGMCLSILLWYRGMIMIHGACLRFKGKTIVIAGDSGSGKSTLTTALINRGAKLMADDVTGVDTVNGEYYSFPAFPAQKLCLDQVEENGISTEGLRQIRYDLNKYEIPRADTFFNEKSKVDYLFRVEPCRKIVDASGVEFQNIDGAEKVKVLTDSIFIKWLFHDGFLFEPQDMFKCIDFIRNVSVYRIVREIGKNTLSEILSYIDNKVE